MSSSPPITDFFDMPPHYKADSAVFKTGVLGGSAEYEQNKSSVGPKDPSLLRQHSHCQSSSSSVPQPFTAPWLMEVAHMTPVRPQESLSLPCNIAPPSATHDYYQRLNSLRSRPNFSVPSHFLMPTLYLDAPHIRHPTRSFSSAESVTPSNTLSPSSIGRPLRPPPTPLSSPPRPPFPLKQTSTELRNKDNYPLDSKGQRERLTSHASENNVLQIYSFPLSQKDQTTERSAKKHTLLHVSSSATSTSTTPNSSARTQVGHSHYTGSGKIIYNQTSFQEKTSFLPKEKLSATPFHPHFRRGSLITLGNSVRRVEDLRTSDFIEAANATKDLILDPSTVGGISPNAEEISSTITFVFPSTGKEIRVVASDDHPFFVFYKGWSSCNPRNTFYKYDLRVRQLEIGDVCISLRRRDHTERTGNESSSASMPPPKPPSKSSHDFNAVSSINVTTESSLDSYSNRQNISSSNISNLESSIHSVPTAATTTTATTATINQLPSVTIKALPFINEELFTSKRHSLQGRVSLSRNSEIRRTVDDGQNIVKIKRKRRWSDPRY